MIVSKETLVEEIKTIVDEEFKVDYETDDGCGESCYVDDGEFNKRLDTLFNDYIVMKKEDFIGLLSVCNLESFQNKVKKIMEEIK